MARTLRRMNQGAPLLGGGTGDSGKFIDVKPEPNIFAWPSKFTFNIHLLVTFQICIQRIPVKKLVIPSSVGNEGR